MALGQLNIWGKSKVEVAIERVQTFEPPEGYYLAYSGGKDSIATKLILDLAGVKYDAHYNLTTVDPPEVVEFIKRQKDVKIHYPEISMWKLIEKKLMPPTRTVRYCCSDLKEGGGDGRFVVTGVRWAESPRRKNTRMPIEFDAYGSKGKKAEKLRKIFLMSDNDEKRKMIETCKIKGKHILNPIVDFEDSEVWELIREQGAEYPKLYDEGFKRLGCIGCPLQGKKKMIQEFEQYPKYKQNYIKAFERMLIHRKKKGLETSWKTGEEVFDWWVNKSF